MFIDFRQGKGEREREKDINWLPLICTPTDDRTHNLGVCPHQGSNLQYLIYRTTLQPTATQPGLDRMIFKIARILRVLCSYLLTVWYLGSNSLTRGRISQAS